MFWSATQKVLVMGQNLCIWGPPTYQHLVVEVFPTYGIFVNRFDDVLSRKTSFAGSSMQGQNHGEYCHYGPGGWAVWRMAARLAEPISL